MTVGQSKKKPMWHGGGNEVMIEIELYPERYSRANQKGPILKIMRVTLDSKSNRKQLKAFTLGKC